MWVTDGNMRMWKQIQEIKSTLGLCKQALSWKSTPSYLTQTLGSRVPVSTEAIAQRPRPQRSPRNFRGHGGAEGAAPRSCQALGDKRVTAEKISSPVIGAEVWFELLCFLGVFLRLPFHLPSKPSDLEVPSILQLGFSPHAGTPRKAW